MVSFEVSNLLKGLTCSRMVGLFGSFTKQEPRAVAYQLLIAVILTSLTLQWSAYRDGA